MPGDRRFPSTIASLQTWGMRRERFLCTIICHPRPSGTTVLRLWRICAWDQQSERRGKKTEALLEQQGEACFPAWLHTHRQREREHHLLRLLLHHDSPHHRHANTGRRIRWSKARASGNSRVELTFTGLQNCDWLPTICLTVCYRTCA